MDTNEAWILDIGTISYEEAFELQKKLVEARARDDIKDTFILLEHFPVFTANRKETFKNIVASREMLSREGVAVCKTDRGGDVTYHGPGQIVGYNIMDLKKQGRDLHAYVRTMEQMILDTLAEYGIDASRDSKHPGVWVGHEKICAVGIAIKSGWITMHGFGLNVNPNMNHYSMIIACGIADKGVTSMQAVLGKPVAVNEVKEKLVTHYASIFRCTPQKITRKDLPWS